MRQIHVAVSTVKGYSHVMKYLDDITSHPQRECIEQRVKIIRFFDDYGEDATRRAFGKSRSTIYLWKQKLKQASGKLTALAPGNRAPIRKRRRIVDPFVQDFIVHYRIAHPRADKATIALALANACKSAGVRPVSESTIGRIIHDLKERRLIPKATKLSINGRSGRLVAREPRAIGRKIRRKGFTPKLPGDLVQMDTVALFVDGLKRYIFTALDVKTRFAFACTYPSASSANGSDFLHKFLQVAPFKISHIQTDNGGEFQKHFAHCCQANHLTHFFNYPRHPQSNGHLERFNRTLQEQFAYWHLDELDDIGNFNRPLVEYLLWYNTEKPHRAIGNQPPLRYYLDNYISNPNKSNMLWTLTCP
jgi:putative transposase